MPDTIQLGKLFQMIYNPVCKVKFAHIILRPSPRQQQCRSNIRHCRKNRSTL